MSSQQYIPDPGVVNSSPALDATVGPPVPIVGPPGPTLVPDALTSSEVTQATGVAWGSSQTSSEATQAAVELPIVSASAPALAPPLALVPPDAPPTSTAVVTATPPTATRTWKRPPVEWEVLDQFRTFLGDHGMQVPANIVSGKWTRILESGADERADVNGSAYTYILNLDKKTPTGTLKTFSGGPPDIFRAEWIEETRPATPRRSKATATAVRPKKAAAEPAVMPAATERATKLWDEARPVTDEELHPYLVEKRIKKAHGLKVNAAGELLVLLRRVEDDVVTGYQHIFPSRKGPKPWDKRVLRNTAPMGAAYRLGEIGPIICIAEGIATAATIREATDWCVFFAYSANNMPNVARAVRERYPTATLVIAADDDCVKAGKKASKRGTQHNAGAYFGRQAAQDAKAHLALAPVAGMLEAEKSEWSDWNDLLGVWSIEQIGQKLKAALDTPVQIGPDPKARTVSLTVAPYAGNEDEMAAALFTALCEDNLTDPQGGLFFLDKDGGAMVRVMKSGGSRETKEGLVIPAGSVSLKEVTKVHLGVRARRVVQWLRVNPRTQHLVPTGPPPGVIDQIHDLTGEEAPARKLKAAICTPTMRPDGSILATPGYDPDTNLFLTADVALYPKVSDQPTREEALAALAVLKYPFSEFVWKAESLSVVLAALLTMGVRPAVVSFAPLILVDASGQSQGKTLCCRGVAIGMTGVLPMTLGCNGDMKELDKQINGLILRQPAIALLDNVDVTLNSAFLSSALTAQELAVRTLGGSRIDQRTLSTVWMMTSNNGELSRDLAERTLTARINVQDEDPKSRRFKIDLLAHMRANSPHIVHAVLTILRAFHVAGRPETPGTKPDGKFPEWNSWVRNALLWLGEPDPLLTQKEMIAKAPDAAPLGECLEAVHAIYCDRSWTAGDLVELSDASIESASLLLGQPVSPEAHLALREALRQIAVGRGRALPDARSMGHWLTSQREKWSAGFHLVPCAKRQRAQTYKVVKGEVKD